MVEFKEDWAQGLDGGANYVARQVKAIQLDPNTKEGLGIDLALAAACLQAETPAGVSSQLDYVIRELQKVRANLGADQNAGLPPAAPKAPTQNFAVIGRVVGWDEDIVRVYNVLDKEAAITRFAIDALELDEQENPDDPSDVDDVRITSVLQADAAISILQKCWA